MADVVMDTGPGSKPDSNPDILQKHSDKPNDETISNPKEVENEANHEQTSTAGQDDAAAAPDDASLAAEKKANDGTEKQSDARPSKHEEDRKNNGTHQGRHSNNYNQRNGRQYDKNKRFGNNDRNNDRKYQNKNKFDPESLPESDDPFAIRKQVEFYFSDSNLFTDKFLFEKIEGHKNLPVAVDVIHSFKRMKHFQPRSAVISALKKSETLSLVNEDNDIQRKQPLPESVTGKPLNEIKKVHEDESMARSIYAKGFGEEEASTQFDIEAFFANYGPTNSVRLRRQDDHAFKGSVFVEFDNEETAKTFLSVEPKPSYKGNELLIKSKKQYCDDKVEDIKAGKIRPASPGRGDRKRYHRELQERREARDLDNDDPRDWKERRTEDAKKGFPETKSGHGDRDFRGFGPRGRGRGRGRGRSGGHDRGRGGRSNGPDRGTQSASSEGTLQSTEAKAGEDGSIKVSYEEKSVLDENKESLTGSVTEAKEKLSNESVSEAKKDSVNESKSEGNTEPSKEAASNEDPAAGDINKETSKKRAREIDETASDEPQAKKLDVGS